MVDFAEACVLFLHYSTVCVVVKCLHKCAFEHEHMCAFRCVCVSLGRESVVHISNSAQFQQESQ